jgi:hypothetical protein
MMTAAFDYEIKSNKQIKKNLEFEFGGEVTTVKTVLSNFKIAKKFRQTALTL